MRLRVMRRAQELNSVTLACREAGISRTVFYRWRSRFERYGADGLHPRLRHARPGRPRQIAPHLERLIMGVALAWPTWGCGRISLHLAREFATHVAPATVQRLLRRLGLPRRRDRLGPLEHHSAGTCGLLTERTRRQLAYARGARSRHVHATQPGELVCPDTFYIRRLKRVGKVWQITACDPACSYGMAWLPPELSADATATFLRQILAPRYRRADWPLQRILTDGGSEFRGAFAETCRALGIKHTRTLPRLAGPTASSSGCRGRSCTNTGASSFAVTTSRAARRCSAASTRS